MVEPEYSFSALEIVGIRKSFKDRVKAHVIKGTVDTSEMIRYLFIFHGGLISMSQFTRMTNSEIEVRYNDIKK